MQKSFLLRLLSRVKLHIAGNSVIVWKQTNRIISAGERLIRKDRRMKLISESNGMSLHIGDVTPDDRGKN